MPDPDSIDPSVKKLAEEWIAKQPNGRVSTLLREILQNGFVTTAGLQRLGLSEPRRARQDAIDRGFPIIKETVRVDDGKHVRHIASYSLGAAAGIVEGRGGRAAIPRTFKAALLKHYGSKDAITGAEMGPRVLTVDHRIPYQVGGDIGLSERNVSAFMLLDGSSQRAKSWSCEQCPNFREKRDPGVCGSCFWAFPENYSHIAMQQIRRTDVVWQDDDVSVHDRLKAEADRAGISMSELLLRLARREA